MAEFALIERFFKGLGATRSDVLLPIGDDAALVRPPSDVDVVSVSATLSAQSANTWSDQPDSMGHRLLSCALNRLSAAGAHGAWLTLAITLPSPDEHWLEEFCAGLSALARRHNLSLIGGDTTSGPLVATVVVSGLAPAGEAITVHGAQLGDRILVSGRLGSAALMTLSNAQPHRFDSAEREQAARQFAFPAPRVEIAEQLRSHATAAVDLSGGLTEGLQCLLKDTGLGATISVTALPVADSLRSMLMDLNLWQHLLSAAGDHEVCLCAPVALLDSLRAAGTKVGVGYTEIGSVEVSPGLRFANRPIVE